MPVIPLRNQRKAYLAGVEQTGLFRAGSKAWAKPISGPAYTRWAGPGWFDASDQATVQQDSGLVSGFLNKRAGGGDLTRAGSVNRMALVPNARNGRAAIRLTRDTAGRPRLVAPLASPLSAMFRGDDKPYTVITAFMPTGTNTGYIWTASATISETASQQIALIRRDGTASVRRQLSESASNDASWNTGMPGGVARIVAVQHTGTVVNVWDNGVKIISNRSQNTTPFSDNLDFALFASRTLGVQGAYGSVQCDLDFYELVAADFAQTDAEIVQAIQDLATKWAITI